MTDLISRADAINTVRVCDVFLAYQGDKIANNIDGFVDSIVEQMRDNISRAVSALPSSEPSGDLISRADAIEALGEEPEIILDTDAEWEMHDRWVDAMTSMKSLPSAEAVSREEVVEIKNNYINEISELLNKIDALSAEATCATCADRAMCVMSDDGGWKACKDYRPSAEAVEVVRCKDCYHAEDDITHMFCVYFGHKVYGEDYCSNAVERREDGEA